MLKLLNTVLKRPQLQAQAVRTFLSQAYYCNEIWEDRLNSPILQKVNLDLLYHELDQRFQKTRRISPVDVDIFANAAKDDLFMDEVLDLVHKLRLTEDTGKTLNSTGHAVVRSLMKHGKVEELLLTLDDRLNYGVFLDDYTANILMDKFWKSKNFVAGAAVASQIMLQEDFKHPLTINLALLHCYNYLVTPGDWPQAPVPEEPEEEVKVRVKYIRNPYHDDHFDLKEPLKIVGKTLAMASNKNDPVHKTLKIVGLALYGKEDLVKKEIESCTKNNIKLVTEILQLLPEDVAVKEVLTQLQQVSEDVAGFLQKQVAESVAATSEKDIANQCSVFKQWESDRMQALEEQKKRLLRAQRLAEIETLQQSLKEKEERLWFFENEEQIELEIQEAGKTEKAQVRVVDKKKEEEEYVPPQVQKRN